MKKLEHKGVHVRLEEPIAKRKEVLESAIYSTELLQKYENFKKIRNLKRKQKALFKKTIKELKLLVDELELKELPTVKIEKPKKEPEEELKITKKKIKEIPKTKSKFAEELEKIRSRLQKLQI